jgi:hypothetical protein
MSPGIGMMKRRLGKEKEAIAMAISGIIKNFKISEDKISTLETKYDDDAGDWYVALGWNDKKAIVKMDSVQGKITEIKEI